VRSSIAATARPATPRGISSRAILPCLRLRFPAPACYAACCRGCAGPTRSRAGRFLIWPNRNWCSRTNGIEGYRVKSESDAGWWDERDGPSQACPKGFAKPSSGLRLPLAVHNELPPGAALRGGWTTMVEGWAIPGTKGSAKPSSGGPLFHLRGGWTTMVKGWAIPGTKGSAKPSSGGSRLGLSGARVNRRGMHDG
jgi:hypothetical protein